MICLLGKVETKQNTQVSKLSLLPLSYLFEFVVHLSSLYLCSCSLYLASYHYFFVLFTQCKLDYVITLLKAFPGLPFFVGIKSINSLP